MSGGSKREGEGLNACLVPQVSGRGADTFPPLAKGGARPDLEVGGPQLGSQTPFPPLRRGGQGGWTGQFAVCLDTVLSRILQGPSRPTRFPRRLPFPLSPPLLRRGERRRRVRSGETGQRNRDEHPTDARPTFHQPSLALRFDHQEGRPAERCGGTSGSATSSWPDRSAPTSTMSELTIIKERHLLYPRRALPAGISATYSGASLAWTACSGGSASWPLWLTPA